MPETLLTIEQVADQLQISTRTVRRLMDRDEIKGFMIGKRWRFTQSEIDAYVRHQQLDKRDTEIMPVVKPDKPEAA